MAEIRALDSGAPWYFVANEWDIPLKDPYCHFMATASKQHVSPFRVVHLASCLLVLESIGRRLGANVPSESGS